VEESGDEECDSHRHQLRVCPLYDGNVEVTNCPTVDGRVPSSPERGDVF
jgi:hypothetical protein